ncbi:MAG: ubiquitin-like domain-containing protein, partial [Actinomycetota bacterium]
RKVRRTRLPGLAIPLVLFGVLAAGGAFFLLGKEITLVVDQSTRSVDTFAGTVGDLLVEQGVAIDSHDEVQPSLSAGLSDGMEVEVLLAKQITLSLNGTQRTVYVTGETVSDVLEQINLRADQSAQVFPSRGASVEDGDMIVYRKAVNVRVASGGENKQVITNEVDVAGLLDNLGIVVDDQDEISPSLSTALTPGMQIRVVQVEIERVVVQQEVAFATEVQKSNDYAQGYTKVLRAGVPGLVSRTFEVRTENGREVARTLVGSRQVRSPVRQIVVEGTRPPSSESGIASWYHRDGMVAAHKTLPFGTEVRVTNVSNGRTVTVVINDRGPYIDGRIIDLSDDAFAALAPLGSGTINVRITW